jgi:heat shock 70kDa protein 1/2/6/8
MMDFCIQDWKKRGQGKTLPPQADPYSDKRAIRRLRTACERAKRMLSTSTSAVVELERFFESLDLNVTITRAKFEELNKAQFEKCITTVKSVLKDANLKPGQINDIVLVGGSTRIPKIQSMLSEYFDNKELCRSINPDEAVAYGAAVQGAILSGVHSSTTQSLLLVDVTPLSLGIETSGKYFSPIIKRNTAIPVKKTKQYSTEEDNQDHVVIPIYEGERTMTDAEGMTLLGEFTITGIQLAKRGEPKIDVTFTIDTNGILSVEARDATTNAVANITIANSRGRLSPEQVAKMVKEAEMMNEKFVDSEFN